MASAERRDGKLESFLNKHLPEEDYGRLLAKQPCVAAIENEKPAHRHVVVGHCRLYLTDVPPKSFRMTLQLQDVESIQILNKPAECLQGKGKDEAVHIRIHFKRMSKQESQHFWASFSDLSPAVMRRLSSGGGNRKSERMSLPSPLLMRNSSRNGSSSDSLHKSSSEHCLEQFSKHQKTQLATPVICAANTKMHISYRSLHITPSNPGNKMPQKQFSQPGSFLSSPQATKSRKRSSLEKSLKMSSQVTSYQQNLSHGLTPADLSDNDSLSSSKSSPSLLNETSSQSLASRGTLQSSTLSLTSSERDLRKRGLESVTEKEAQVLDLYILNPNTDFYHQLCAAWQDQKIAMTLGYTHSSQQNKTQGLLPCDHFSHHFHTLRQELVSATNVQESAQLAHELCTACKKYFIIKRLFWEDHSLPDLLIEKLQYTLSERKPTDKELAIEIEYRVIVLDLLYQMLRETHGIQRRFLVLTTNGGRYLRLLTNAVVLLLPTLSKQGLFKEELIEKSCGVLSEVLRLTQQVRWPHVQGGVVSPEWLTDILAKHPCIREFCQVIIAHESTTLHLDQLEPHNVLSIYHVTYTLSYLVEHSRLMLNLIHTEFEEEFKYFISVAQARQKLPENAPLTSETLSLLQHVKAKVLKS